MRYAQNDNVYESTAQYATDWSSINWYKVEKHVDKLQKRIYHAESIGDSRKVRDLQRILVRSTSAILIAVKRVTQIENHLIKMSWTKIKRHKMIIHNYSPYDKSKEDYFMNR